MNEVLGAEKIRQLEEMFSDYDVFTAGENVNHPQHYTKGIEPIDFIESWNLGFSLGNAVKYICRAPYKGREIEDLRKAQWYLEREILRLERNERDDNQNPKVSEKGSSLRFER